VDHSVEILHLEANNPAPADRGNGAGTVDDKMSRAAPSS
jgi:hypothetical protein